MTVETIPRLENPAPASPLSSASQGLLARIIVFSENGLLHAVLAGLVLLPLVEMVLRKLSLGGIAAANPIIQHATLVLGMLGGAVAARESRLLTLSPASTLLKGFRKELCGIFSGGVSAAISLFLCLAGVQFLLAERTGGKILAYDIPVWVVQLIIPAGFVAIAARLVWGSSPRWLGRGAALALAAGLVSVILWSPWDSEQLFWPAVALLVLATLLGAPIFAAIGGLALVLLWGSQLPVAAVALKHYSLVTSPTLPTIPLFTLAGYLLAEGGASRRLVRVFQSIVGPIHAGPAVVTALVCAYFTSFTGASGVTILALGGLLLPVLLAAKYSERNALGLLTAAGSLGVLLPPCLPLILYSIVAGTVLANLDPGMADQANLTMEKMFMAGLLPGLVLVAMTAWLGVRQAPKVSGEKLRYNWREVGSAVADAKWELLLPVVAIVALFGGFATPVEASALTAAYAFIVETVIYRDLSLRQGVPKVLVECGLLVGGVFLILGVAMGFTNFLVTEQIPDVMVEWVQRHIHSRWAFLLALNLFLLVVGCLMDIFSAIVVVVPLIVPLGIAFGVDQVHLGIIFLANLQLGYLTPPVGMNLFLASYRFDKPISEVVRAVLPMFFILLVGVILITYIPALSTFLPKLIK